MQNKYTPQCILNAHWWFLSPTAHNYERQSLTKIVDLHLIKDDQDDEVFKMFSISS